MSVIPVPSDVSKVPLVVIGASAGGLEPLEAFFEAMPLDPGWAFVVIQHLSPDYKSMMSELLARRSSLRIHHIEDGKRLEPNAIYLNVPSMLVTLDDEVFRTRSYTETDRLPNLPIDAFVTSVAARDPARTAAVILSGSGSDGTRGSESLHSSGGLVIVQSLTEASFASMPRSALAHEVADRVLPVREIPAALNEFFLTGDRKRLTGPSDTDSPKSILKLLEDAHGIDFSDYKPQNVQRRIERRRHLKGYATLEEFQTELQNSPAALEELYHDLLIGVTEFFRDPDTIEALRTQVLDVLAAEPDETTPMRIWVPACSSGEEAYTIAIQLSEALASVGSNRSFRIIATDVHRRSIDIASAGSYSISALDKVPADLRARYFDKHHDRYVVTPSLRQKIIFSVHDTLSDPPFMRLDLVSCRNLLIYLTEPAQARVISMFLFGLKTGGFLLLGSSESLGRYVSEFRSLDGRWRLFQKATERRGLDRSILSTRFGSNPRADGNQRGIAPQQRTQLSRDVTDIRDRASLTRCYDALLKRYAPSSILVTDDGTVLAWFGAASRFVDTMNNLAGWTVEEIVHPDLHFVINVATEKLRQDQLETYERSITVTLDDTGPTHCEVRIEPLHDGQGGRLMLVTLDVRSTDAPQPVVPQIIPDGIGTEDSQLLSRRVVALERDLRLTEETLQHVTERLEASGEELQASNEELQASNEELQASNEELQSSNEELHAVNEELISVSSEHERQIETLSSLNQSFELVLETMDVGVIFVDADLRVRRFSDLIARAFELESHDIMRNLAVIGPRLEFVDLAAAVGTVIRTQTPMTVAGPHQQRTLHLRIRAFGPNQSQVVTGETGAILIFQWTDPTT